MQAMDILKGEDAEGNEGVPSRSYFRVKEGSGVGKKSANKVTDIGIVEEKVSLLFSYCKVKNL